MQAAVTRHSAEGCSRADSAGCGQELSCNSQQQQRSDILRVRKAHYGPNTSLNYETPLHIVRGEGCYLYDAEGQAYLDGVNNVAHCGHGHPKVAAAIANQLCVLNTNSRYLHHTLTQYTQALLSTLPPELEVLYMVNSGSEANDLALRIARAARPGATHVAVMGAAYHGHTGHLISLSPYKFWAKGGEGKEAHVHVVPCPDTYRGEYLDGAAAARAVIEEAHTAGGRICAFFAESVLSCGGQVIMPQGYLQGIYDEMHAEGAVCIADEVQCGFGRVGSHFWGFQTQRVTPDIVTMGKPMGNGYPVAGVVMRRELAEGFNNGMEYFNTYGGSTAQAAAALAVLHTIWEEGYQAHAHRVGQHLLSGLQALCSQWPFLGDARGLGLMLGIEVVLDPVSKAHAPRVARWIKERAKAHRVLLSTDGPYDNVIKMKPPMVFGEEEADQVLATLSRVLSEELTPGVWAALMIEEGQHWAATYGPRMALYEGNERALRLLTHDTSGGRRQAESARAQQVQAGASAAGKNLQQQQPASSAPLWSTKPLQQTQGQRRRGSGHVGKESSVQLQLSATSGTTSAPHHQQQLQVVLPSKL